MVAPNAEVEAVVQQVKFWPAETRIALARRVLETLESGSAVSTGARKGPPASQVLGVWSPEGAVPTDEQCDQILVEELQKKYGA